MNSRIIKELPQLVENKVITEDVALKIEAYYLTKQKDEPKRIYLVFGVLGSLLIGLGIILILAHNWDNFTKAVKTSFAFLPLIVGQIFVGYSIMKERNATWKESSATFLFCAIGSSISLVSQIYNIPGDLSAFLLTWTLLALPLVYLLNSNAVAILCVILSTYYAVDYGYGYLTQGSSPWLYCILLALVLPYYLKTIKQNKLTNIISIFNWILPISLIIVLGSFVESNEEIGFLMYVIVFGIFYNIGKLPYFQHAKLRQNGYLVLGSLGTIFMLLLTGFKWFWEELSFNEFLYSQELYISAVLFLIAIFVLIYLKIKKQLEINNLFHYVFMVFAVLFFVFNRNSIIPAIVINVITFVLGVTTIKIGAKTSHLGILNYGLFILTGLIICRFFDVDMSFVVRGLLFMAIGAGFFLANYLTLKKKQPKN